MGMANGKTMVFALLAENRYGYQENHTDKLATKSSATTAARRWTDNERRMIMDINLKKVTKDKLIEMLTEEQDEKKRRISELESAVKAGQNREMDLRRKVDEFRDLYFEQCDKVKALREHPWKNLWIWLKGRFS